MNIEYKIKSLRKQHGMTQEELANILDISRPTYMAIEEGKTDISAKNLHWLCTVYEVRMDDFFDDSTDLMSTAVIPRLIKVRGLVNQMHTLLDDYTIKKADEEKYYANL